VKGQGLLLSSSAMAERNYFLSARCFQWCGLLLRLPWGSTHRQLALFYCLFIRLGTPWLTILMHREAEGFAVGLTVGQKRRKVV